MPPVVATSPPADEKMRADKARRSGIRGSLHTESLPTHLHCFLASLYRALPGTERDRAAWPG